MPNLRLENLLGAREGRRVVGLDESGRGPWAGPVVAAAVALEPKRLPRGLARRINDCKLMQPQARREAAQSLLDCAAVGVGIASVEEIDGINILRASLLAMQRAVEGLGFLPDAALVDGREMPEIGCTCQPVIGGDRLSLSVAAASVIAKVHRDRLMDELAELHPGYGWEHNRGYGTLEHQAALRLLGVTEQHRRSFRPIRELLGLTA